jgi:hypothetical protein
MTRLQAAGFIVLALSIALTPAAAPAAGGSYHGWGPRIGMTVDPDQIHFGLHVDLGYLGEQFRFRPNMEIGVGSNMTLVALNAEAAYEFYNRRNTWYPYLGGGFGLNFVDADEGGRNP